MEYNKLVAVSGLPGLFEVISSKNDGAIVRSLVDKTTRFAASRVHQFSHLESIEIYTVRDNVNLAEVFTAMENDGSPLPDTKDEKAVKAYFEKVYPEMDFGRVYVSDMKKMVKWLDILKTNDIAIKLATPEETADAAETDNKEAATPADTDTATAAEITDPTEATEATEAAPAPAKKTAAKKKAPAKKKEA